MKCKKCGGTLKHRDWVNRIVKTKGGQKETIKIERVICCDCGTLTRILPSYLTPFKHYENDVIDGVREGFITPDTYGYENFPCEMTMKRWKSSQE